MVDSRQVEAAKETGEATINRGFWSLTGLLLLGGGCVIIYEAFTNV